MKKHLLTLGLLALTTASALAQGTINPLNGTLTRLKWDSNGNGLYETTDANVTASDGLRLGLFWGPAGSTADALTLAGELTVGTTAGIMVGLPAIFSVQGWGDVGTVVSLQFRAISPGWFGQTDVKQVTLAPAAGPGTVIWGSTATASRFSPNFYLVPEPSILALGALGGLMLLFRSRNSNHRNP